MTTTTGSLTPRGLADHARLDRCYASQAPAALHVSPWMTPHDLYLVKRAELAPSKGNAATSRGNELEGWLLEWAAGELGVEIETHADSEEAIHFFERGKPEPFLFGCHLDARIVHGEHWAIEAKAPANIQRQYVDQWGEPGTAEVPEHVAVQVQVQCAAAELDGVHVVTELPQFGILTRLLYHVPRDEEFIRLIRLGVAEFWEQHIRAGVPPADTLPSMDTLKRIKRTEGKRVAVPDELVETYRLCQAEAREAKKRKEAAQAALIAALGDAEVGESDLGEVTYLEVQRREYTVKAGSYRKLHVKKAKD